MPRLGFGLPLVSSTQESPITLIEDLLWEDIDTNNNISVNYQETRTNVVLHSQDTTDAEAWTKGNTAIDSTLYEAPDNSTTANAIKSNSTGEKVYNINQSGLSVTAGKTYTLSAHVKKQNLGFAQLRFSDGDGLPRAQFNLTTGAVTNTANVIRTQVDAMDDDWYRCSITFVATTSSGSAMVMAQSAAGDGTPNIAVSGIVLLYVWGWQLEENSEPSAYIKTTTSARTTTEVLNDFSNVWDFDNADLMPEADPQSEGAWEVPANVVLNGDYEELGSELVTNGDFATDSDWSFNASYWNISGGTANALGVANGGFSQTLSVTSGKVYEIKISSSITSGNGIYAVLLGTNQQTFDNNTSEITTYITASGNNVDISIRPGSSAFSINSVSVKQVDPNDRWTLGDGWSIEDGKLKSVNGGNYTAYQNLILTSGTTYEIKYTISDYSSGTFGVRAHTAAGITATANGTYTDQITSNGTHLYFIGFTTFNGSVDNVSVTEYAIQPQDV